MGPKIDRHDYFPLPAPRGEMVRAQSFTDRLRAAGINAEVTAGHTIILFNLSELELLITRLENSP